VKPHEAVACLASVAVHVTAVVLTGKTDPDAGVHVTLTGAVPPSGSGGG
jgi:hypothetical protein